MQEGAQGRRLPEKESELETVNGHCRRHKKLRGARENEKSPNQSQRGFQIIEPQDSPERLGKVGRDRGLKVECQVRTGCVVLGGGCRLRESPKIGRLKWE